MENLIHIINKLQDCFSSLGATCPIDLPQIAVVGEQSAGKSSVLENFVGKDFLPRGSGIVTRRPLILQLVNKEGPEYAEFLHTKGKKFTDFLQVRKEIEDETDRVTGSNKNISPIPINLRVFSPHVLTLTLIDLPGLTKVPVGDQPADIEKQIREMLYEFIKSPNCLILAVTPAIIDLANSEALKLAHEVDPEGNRTIGVITKIDMMDKGTNCVDILNNKTYPLRRGYIGIVNRNQQDIEGKKDIRAAQEAEMKFFLTHPSYRGMANRMGSRFLQQTLSSQLSQHIKDSLPELKEKIMEQMAEIEKDMEINKDLFISVESGAGKTRIFMQKVQDLSRDYDSILGFQNENISLSELSKGTVISRILFQRFNYELAKVKGTPAAMKKEIKIAIQNTRGIRLTIFSADASFNVMVKKHLEKTRDTCIKTVDVVAEEMRQLIDKSCFTQFKSYPLLLSEVLSFFAAQLSACIAEAKKYVNYLLDIQLNHINTNHPDFSLIHEEGIESNQHKRNGSTGNVPVTIENQVYKKGKMQIAAQSRLKSNREHFFVLKGANLLWYKDEQENDIKNQISISDCKFREYDAATASKRNYISIFNKDGKSLAKDMKVLDLICPSPEETDNWKSAFITAGVAYDRPEDQAPPADDEESIDPALIKQIEYVYLLVETYVGIVRKIEQDIVSKICVHSIIKKLRNTILTDLISHIYSNYSLDDLMKESDESSLKRQELLNIYKSCKEALNIVNTFMIKTDFTKEVQGSNTNLPSKAVSNISLNSSQPNQEFEDNFNSFASNPNMFNDISNKPAPVQIRNDLSSFNFSSNQSSNQPSNLPSTPVRKPQRPPPRG